jgi:hypothetical protein
MKKHIAKNGLNIFRKKNKKRARNLSFVIFRVLLFVYFCVLYSLSDFFYDEVGVVDVVDFYGLVVEGFYHWGG